MIGIISKSILSGEIYPGKPENSGPIKPVICLEVKDLDKIQKTITRLASCGNLFNEEHLFVI